jgi:hypothetical protein
MAVPPFSTKNGRFFPLHDNGPQPSTSQHSDFREKDDHIVHIPLSPIRSNVSTGARKEGQTLPETPEGCTQDNGIFHRRNGRRRAGSNGMQRSDEGALTTMGRIYDKVLGFSILTRYMLYIIPLSTLLLIPLLLSIKVFPNAKIGGVRMSWFFVWVSTCLKLK